MNRTKSLNVAYNEAGIVEVSVTFLVVYSSQASCIVCFLEGWKSGMTHLKSDIPIKLRQLFSRDFQERATMRILTLVKVGLVYVQVEGLCKQSMATQGDTTCCYLSVQDACETGCAAACERASQNANSSNAYQVCIMYLCAISSHSCASPNPSCKCYSLP